MKEDQILLSLIQDKIQRSGDSYMVTNTAFLDMRQRTLAENLCKKSKGLHYLFYGGYENAERTIGIFIPDYIEERGQALIEYLTHEEEINPLAVLRLTRSGGKELNHRDYLGALLGLGIKREMVGDILVRKDGADVIILKEISNFLLYHFDKAGKVSLHAELLPLEDIIVPEGMVEEKRDTVASLRLDNVIASAFSVSRGRALEAIKGGIIFVNGLQIDKPDRMVKEGDKLVFRGKGKVILKTVGHLTKKERIFIVIDKYL